MAANCVTKQQKRSPEYIGAMEKLDISSSVLELLLFEYQSLPENEEAFSKGELPFPSIEYLQGQLYAPAITVLDGSIIEYYDKHLNDKTFTTKTLQEAKNTAHVIGKRIGHNSVKVVETKNGQYKVLTTRPKLDASVEIEKILSNAPRDEQGRLLAPNGKPSNLTERQYAQVRTKAFMDWFGDWINAPENASKVVDENGEPMVVYHGTSKNFNSFITSYLYDNYVGINNDLLYEDVKKIILKEFTELQINNYLKFEEDDYSSGEYSAEAIDYRNINYRASELTRELLLSNSSKYRISETLVFNGVFFTTDKNYTKQFGPNTFEVFLNIRNPYIKTKYGLERSDFLKEFKNNDGVKGHDTRYKLSKNYIPSNGIEYVVKDANQIKSATDNIGTFSRESDNIYASRKDATHRQGIQSIEDIFGKGLFEPGTTISIQDAVKALEKNKEIAPMVSLLKHLQGAHPEITIYRQDKVFDSRGREVDGLYDADNKKIIISNNSTKPVGQVLTHELLHPLLLDKLNANPEIRSELDRIRENAISVLGEEALKYYGLTSVEELISEVLTEGKLIKALDNIEGIKNTKAKGILQQIRDWFNKCLHLIFKKEPSLLDNALYEIELLISSNSEYTEQSFDIIERKIYSMRGYDASELESRLLEVQKNYPWLFKTDKVTPFIVMGNDGKYKVKSSYKGEYLLNNRKTANKKLRDLHKGEFSSTKDNYKYTKIDTAFRLRLLNIIEKSDFKDSDYTFSRNKKALIEMTNALFDFFEREGFRILITNNTFDGKGGSVVVNLGKDAIIYYQEHELQGGKILNIIHELLHLATNQISPFEAEGRYISNDVLQGYYDMFCKKLQEDSEYKKWSSKALQSTSEEEFNLIPGKYRVLIHAASSPGEFLSSFISNIEVRQVTSTILYNDSIFDKIIDSIKEFFQSLFKGYSYLDSANIIDDITSFLLDNKYTGEYKGLYYTEEGKKELDAFNKEWEAASDINTNINEGSNLSAPSSVIAYTDPLGDAIESLLGIDSIMYRDEVEELAHKVCIKISDTLTNIQNDPSIVEVITNGRVKGTPEMSRMTRNKLLQTIGVNDIVNYIKELTFGSGNDAIADDMFEMADLLYNNFNTLVSFGMSTFAATEGFSFSLSENTVTVTEDNSSIEDVDEAELSENEGSRQEAWQVESVTKSVIDRMALDVKAELQRCKVLDENGNEVVDRWGLSDNIPLQQATQTILTVTRGSFTLSDMIDKMEKGVKTYPWLQLLLPKLKDKSGQYSSFQSQFYNAMQSHFQLYSVVVNENGKIATKPVNKDTALTEAKRSIVALYNIRQHPLFDSRGAVNKSSLETLKTNLEQLKSKDVEDKLPIVQEVLTILGYDNTDSDFLASIVNDDVVKEISNSLHYIIKGLESHKDDKIITWKPFSADPKDKGIINNISKVIKPFTDVTIDATLSSFHADGKMYQSNKIPSYLTKLFLKFSELSNVVQSATELTPYYKFLQEEYGYTEWFRDSSEDLGVEVNLEMQKGWRLPWLQMLASDPKAREIFAHKVDISFDKKGYMKSSTGKYMNELEYALMVLGEYFSETTSENNLADKVPAWFRVPMQSNKPSADFIRFYSYRGQNYKDAIVKDLLEIFNQELSRMQTCTMRKKEIAKDKSIEISSFDKNGTKFCFLDFLEGKRKDTDFGKLVEKKINGEEVNEAELLSQAELLIRESMEQRIAEMLNEFEANGIVKQASKVKGINTSNIKEDIENFLWNDFLASINILELTITDVANYKNAEDLQKRLAQIHAPGNRPNIEATDLEGNKVTDGTYRTIILEDFEGFKSNVVENLRYVFDLELAKLSDDNPNKATAKATYDRIIEQFEKEVNVTDALGYSCPTSYRKKALMFGRWSKRHEAIYQKLLKGESTLTDIEEAFRPLKPFVYSNTTRSSYAENAPIKNLKVGVLYKNSEYMLVMADALIRRVSNGRPNLLKAIFKVMEDSYKKDVTKGLDTIQFKSSMKTGISGVLSLNDLVNDSDGYNKAVKRLEDAIYDKNGKDGYNVKHVHASPFEDYCIQQEVPPHFKNHYQAHGSQTRAIIPSDLDPNVKYKVGDLEYTALELIEEYESLIYENIKDSYTDLYRELEWNKDNQYTEEGKANLKRHLSEILKRELLSSQRHSLDLFYACTLKDGDFRVPLGDAVQSNKVEQLINSIIKNRINKQEIAGGPVVQASSFGLSKQLNMIFKDSNGKPLKTLKEFGGTEELYKQYVKDNQGSFSHMEVYAPIYDERLLEFLDADGTIDIKAIEKLNPELLDLVSYRIPTEDKYSIIPCKIVGFVPREAGEVIMMPEEITLLTGSDYDIDKMYLMRKEFDIKKKSAEQIIQDMSEKLPQASKELLSNFLKELKEHPYAARRKYPTVWKAYKESAYETSLPKDLRAVRNNKIIDITLSVLSHPSTTALQMTPGGFDEQRKVGYMVEAYKLGKGTWQLLEKMSINLLKDLCYTSKNLNFFDTQMQFYKLNSAAGSILAIFAVAKVAHAIFQTRHIEIDVKTAMGIKQKGGFSIQLGNSSLTPMMRLDATFNDNGQYIGKVLGEMVASSADAVKDPILNLMNINVETVNILNSLIRLGIPFKTAAMFLSSKAISNALNDYYKESLTLNISFTQVVKNKLKDLHQENNISWIYEGLSNEELLDAIKGGDPKLDIKVLQMFLGISNLASSVQKASFITRFNSMSSAVGPLVIDNLITEMKLHDFPLETIYLKKNGELVDLSALSMLDEFPILNAFKQTLTLSNAIFGEDIITNSKGFRRMIASLSEATLKTLMSDRNAFCKLGDFYKSAMLIYSEVFNSEDLKYYIHDFPKEFIVLNFKEKFPKNKFVQLLKYNIEKGSERLSLGIELTGMDKRDLDKITAAWLDLYKSNGEGKKLAIDLVKYFFFKGGIGFSPKTPLHLLPVLLRLVIPGYMDAFGKKRVLPHEVLVYQQFVQNYWQNNKIAPIRKVELHDEGGELFSTSDIPMHLEGTYFKMKNSDGQFDLYYVVAATKDYANVVKIPKLGNNGEYIEINQLDLQPMESTISNDLEIEDETEIIEVGTTSPQLKEEEPIDVQDDAVSVKEKLETLLNDVQKERVSQLKDMSKEELQSRKNATLAWMKRIFKQHGIEVSELNLEKTFEEYCS